MTAQQEADPGIVNINDRVVITSNSNPAQGNARRGIVTDRQQRSRNTVSLSTTANDIRYHETASRETITSLHSILSKISVVRDTNVSEADVQRIRNACTDHAKKLLASQHRKAHIVSPDEHRKFIDQWNSKKHGMALSAVPSTLPPYELYDPPQNSGSSMFTADRNVGYLNFYFQQPPLSSPTDQPGIDPDYANWISQPTGTFGHFTLQSHPKGRLRRLYVTAHLNGFAIPEDFGQLTEFFGGGSDAANPWMVQFVSGNVFRYPNTPPDYNPANVLAQWNTLAHLDAIATWNTIFWVGTYYEWRWQIDMPGDGVLLEPWDMLRLVTGPAPKDYVQRLFVTGDIQLLPSAFSYPSITHETFVTTSFSSILNAQ